MIVVDASAIIAVMLKERGYERVADVIAHADACRISPATLLEVTMVMSRTLSDPKGDVDVYLRETSISLSPVDANQAEIAQMAFLNFGKGRHKARLNIGDCFSYAAAKALNAPLLYVGDDFAKTDIRTA